MQASPCSTAKSFLYQRLVPYYVETFLTIPLSHFQTIQILLSVNYKVAGCRFDDGPTLSDEVLRSSVIKSVNLKLLTIMVDTRIRTRLEG